MSLGGLTGAGGGSIAGSAPKPEPPKADGSVLISHARSGPPKTDSGDRDKPKTDIPTSNDAGVDVPTDEQSQKLQDFDAVRGRPSLGEGDNQPDGAVSSGNVRTAKLDGVRSSEPRQEICADVSGTDDPPCVLVEGGEALSTEDKKAFASAYHDFIVKNDGADLSKHSADVVGYNKEDTAKVRVASQFIGANLPDGWRNTRIIAGSGDDLRMSSDTAGNTEWQKIATDDPPELYIVKINMDWGDHRTNPSGLARTMIHESLHRHDEGGWVTVVNDQHRALDSEARNRLQDYGLGAGGCLPVGEFLWGLFPPAYPGCSE